MTRIASPHNCKTTTLTAAKPKLALFASLIGCALILGLPFVALSDETSPVEVTTEVSPAQLQANAVRQLVADRIASKMAAMADAIALSQNVAISQSLQELDNKSTSLSSIVNSRIDAQLASAMTNFRVKAYAKAQADPANAYQVANQH